MLSRLTSSVITMIFVLVIVFFALEALPGDACTAYLERDAVGELLANCRTAYGLDKSVLVRFLDWSYGLLHGDLGNSLVRDRPVTEVLAPRIRNTFILTGTAAFIAIPLAFLLGTLAAIWRDSIFDICVSSVSLFAMTIPEFVLATVLIFAFAITLHWFPAVTVVPLDAPVIDMLPNIVLPVIVLSLIMIAHIMRVARTSLIDAMSSDFVQMSNLRGLSFPRVVLFHAIPSALLPTLNVVAMSLASLFGGVVVIERVFNYPGLGTMTLQAIYDRDLNIVQGAVIVFTVTYIGFTLLADLITFAVDPRVRRASR